MLQNQHPVPDHSDYNPHHDKTDFHKSHRGMQN